MSDDSAAHDATSLAHIDIDDVNEQDEVTNDPVSRFANIRAGFDSVNMLSDSLRHNWADRNAPLPEPRRTQRDIANEYQQASANYHSAVLSEDERDIRFWNAVCANLDAELAAISSSTVDSNEESSSNNND
jgi:hypothetical protein